MVRGLMNYREMKLMLVLAGVLCAAPREVKMIRKPAVAGQFYPAEPKQLATIIDRMIKQASPPQPGGEVLAIQVPHAGIEYSGPTAAYAYKLLAGMDSVTVFMLGPSHQAEFDRAAVYARGAWETPLGRVEIDESLAGELLHQDSFFADLPAVHGHEHSLEVQLPFLQRTLRNFKIVPIMLLFPNYEQLERIGRAIARVARGRRVLLLASSDLYHGYSYQQAKASDSLTVGMMTGFDPRQFYQALVRSYAEQKPLACGGFPIVAVMLAARELGASRAVVLHQTNSNDVLGQQGGYCVGYSAVAFIRDAGAPGPEGEKSGELNEAEKKSLLQIARQTIEQYVREGKVPEVKPASERLKEKRGVFVTLHKHGELRGCIGYVQPVKPLYLATRDMAISAATEDPRFPPVQPAELKEIDIEITVLSPLQRISDPEQVILGKHGLVIRKGPYSGLLLPQVPVEQGWDRRQFLEWTCRKAGLPSDAWQDKNAELYVFTGEVFGEREYQK
ncbi:MAG: AmmeMemoRadiSam system protein B [candidate division WOR-3 bacterium]